MNKREARRVALEMAARWAADRASRARQDLPEGFHLFAPEAITGEDTERVAEALEALADQLHRRSIGERKPASGPIIAPGQLSWLSDEDMAVL